jgi:hypothetical protein
MPEGRQYEYFQQDNVAACLSDTFMPIVLEAFESKKTSEVSTDDNYRDS